MRLLLLLIVSLAASFAARASDVMKFMTEQQTQLALASRAIVDNGRWNIYATGEIDSGAADRLKDFVVSHHIDFAIVVFDSPGGSLIGGMQLGQAIRSLKFDTGIGRLSSKNDLENQGMCASACAYAFAGGVHRFYGGGKQQLGIQQFSNANGNVGDLGDTQLVSGLLVSYLQKMGVNATAFSVASTTRSGGPGNLLSAIGGISAL